MRRGPIILILLLVAVGGIALSVLPPRAALVAARAEPLVDVAEHTISVGDEADLLLACAADEAMGVWWSVWPSEGIRVRLALVGADNQWRPTMIVRPTQAGKWSLCVARATHDGRLFASAITIVSLAPEPRPDPTPGPTPGPKVAVIVEESSQRTPAQARLLLDPQLRTRVAAVGHVLYVADRDAVVRADLRPYVELAAGKQLPLLIVATSGGKIVKQVPMPTTVDAVITALE